MSKPPPGEKKPPPGIGTSGVRFLLNTVNAVNGDKCSRNGCLGRRENPVLNNWMTPPLYCKYCY